MRAMTWVYFAWRSSPIVGGMPPNCWPVITYMKPFQVFGWAYTSGACIAARIGSSSQKRTAVAASIAALARIKRHCRTIPGATASTKRAMPGASIIVSEWLASATP